MRTRPLAAGALLVLLLAGCSLPFRHRGNQEEEPQEEETIAQDVSLRVSNHNWSNIVVYAVSGSARVRLGDVNTGNDVQMVIPRNLVLAGSVMLVLHPIGAPRDFGVGPILVQGGQEIALRVENNLAQTNWSVSGP